MWNKFEYFSIKNALNFIKIKSKINLDEYDFYIGEKNFIMKKNIHNSLILLLELN